MDTGDMILLGAVAGGALWLAKRASSKTSSTAPLGGGLPTGSGLYTGNDLGPLKPVLALPLLAQTYQLLAPVNAQLQSGLNYVRDHSDGYIGANVTRTQNADGTYTQKFHDSKSGAIVREVLVTAPTQAVTAVAGKIAGLFS